jgi:hypothetical protein
MLVGSVSIALVPHLLILRALHISNSSGKKLLDPRPSGHTVCNIVVLAVLNKIAEATTFFQLFQGYIKEQVTNNTIIGE